MSELRFTKEHEWARIEGEVAICGITDYAQQALGDIVYVELPTLGQMVVQNGQVAVVESAKAASEVYAPLDGEVIDTNHVLTSDPSKVNAAATGDGWFFKIKMKDQTQLDHLMNESEYQNYVKGLLVA